MDCKVTSFFGFSEAPVRAHLKSVYASLACSIFSAAAGAYVHLFTGLLKVCALIVRIITYSRKNDDDSTRASTAFSTHRCLLSLLISKI